MNSNHSVGARGVVRRVCVAAFAAGLLVCVFSQVASASGPPIVATESAWGINGEATLNGIVDPNGLETKYYFEYGLTSSYGSKTTETSAGSGTSLLEESATITGLETNKEYHYRIVATNSGGTAHGADKTFTVEPTPKFTRLATFSGNSSGNVEVETGNSHAYICTSSSMSGETISSPYMNKADVTLRLKKCQAGTELCDNSGEEIVISSLVGELGFIHKPESGKEEDGMRLRPASGNEFAKFQCGGGSLISKVTIRGSVIAPIKELSREHLQYTFAKGSGQGKPAVTHFEGGPEYALEAESTGFIAYSWTPFAFATQLTLTGELGIEA